jgi:hypothetical protein
MIEPREDDSYERKVFLEGVSLPHVESLIRLHPHGFRELHHERWINNLYFDSSDFVSFWTNEGGVRDRLKYRARWYGDLLNDQAALALELKFKRGFIRRKQTFPIGNANLSSGFIPALNILADADLPSTAREQLQLLRPVLINRYARRYYTSWDGRFRITLDRDVSFRGLRGPALLPTPPVRGPHGTILEIKYTPEDDDAALSLMSFFPFRLTKNSKYVTGVERLHAARLLGGVTPVPVV